MRPLPPPSVFGRAPRRVHCLGVGGAGVGPLAILLSGLGFSVSGEDDGLGEEMAAHLSAAGVAVGPLPADCELVVRSSAIPPSHPACAAAAARRLPLVLRGDMLAEIVRERKLVAVSGAHGKTTTTGMLVTALRSADFPAAHLLGGLFCDGAPPARVSSGDWIVAEVDESDGTIERFSPEITVAVSVDWDHPDHYRSRGEIEAAFGALFARTRGAVLLSDACPGSLRAAAASGVPCFTFGRSGDYRAEILREGPARMTLRLGGRFPEGEAEVRARGEFNAANAAAALAAARLMGASPGAGALAGYAGVRRRQAVLSSSEGITVIEDYAHHPTEIRALLGSLRRRLGGRGRLIVVFQPHRFSRTAQFKSEFAAALALSDRLHLLDVYPAGEAPVAGGTSADIYAEIGRGSPGLPVDYIPGGGGEPLGALAREARPGDLIAFVGAGDIDRQARAWLATRGMAAEAGRRWDGFADSLKARLSPETKLRREEPLARKTTLMVGGAARVYAEPAGEKDLQELLRAAAAAGVRVFMLGRGSNLIVPDSGVDGLVIALGHPAWAVFEPGPDGRVRAGAGLRLKNLCGLATKAGLSGFEFMEGIPGTVGGALRMNAGAMGSWFFDVVEEVRLMTMAGEPLTLKKSDLHVEYRLCSEVRTAVALGAVLRPLGPSDAEGIGRQVDVYRRKRHESQPREPSAGCVFKNPPGNFAGKLIDLSGLKGERVGDAEVSPVHANFIVNRGHATGADVLELIRRVRAQVRARHGVDLEPEVLLYGGEWEEVL